MGAATTKLREGTDTMEFSVKKYDLLEELEMTQGVVERKTTIPILSNLLFEGVGNKLSLTATDLELSICTSCEAKIKKEGSGTIPAKKLLELVRLLARRRNWGSNFFENPIGCRLNRESANTRWSVHVQGKFPGYPRSAARARENSPRRLCQGLISRTVFAISAEESRYTLNGGLLLVKPDSITMVATDGHRLALAETEHKIAGLNAEVRVLVPKKALLELQRLTAEAGEEGSIEFSRDDSYLFFQVGSRRLVSRILTGQFPNYPAVMPRDNNKFVVLERNELNDAIRRVSQLADQRSRAVETFRFHGRRGTFRAKPGIRRSDGNNREAVQRRSDYHRIQRAIFIRFSRRNSRRPRPLRAEGRTIRRPNSPRRRRPISVSLCDYADADLMANLAFSPR